jgi:hypothetical protein
MSASRKGSDNVPESEEFDQINSFRLRTELGHFNSSYMTNRDVDLCVQELEFTLGCLGHLVAWFCMGHASLAVTQIYLADSEHIDSNMQGRLDQAGSY